MNGANARLLLSFCAGCAAFTKGDKEMPSVKKFREALVRFAIDPETIGEINEGYETLAARSSKKQKAAFFERATRLLDERLSCEENCRLFDYGACRIDGVQDRVSGAFAKKIAMLPLSEKVQAIWELEDMGRPELLEDGTILAVVSYYRDGKYGCACPIFHGLKDVPRVSPTYCFCCAGHFRHHYQKILGVTLRTKEIVSSALNSNGGRPCAFTFFIEPPV